MQFGFSSAAIPTILSGQPPTSHKHLSFYYYDPKQLDALAGKAAGVLGEPHVGADHEAGLGSGELSGPEGLLRCPALPRCFPEAWLIGQVVLHMGRTVTLIGRPGEGSVVRGAVGVDRS